MYILQSLGISVGLLLVVCIAALLLWLKFMRTKLVCKSNTTLDGKTVLITGANSGIGKETAIELAKRKARIIIACRDVDKAITAVKEIREKSGKDAVHCMKLDLADLASIREFAEEFIATEPKLHILINNAATVDVGKTEEGFDKMFGINQLGPFLLTNLLLPLIKKTSLSSPVRIVNLTSEVYRLGKIDFNNLSPNLDEKSTGLQIFTQYANTKLMNVYFTTELQKRLQSDDPNGQKITTFALHPGAVNTNLALDLSRKRGLFKVCLRRLVYLWSISCFEGCQTTLHCCLEKGLEDDSGKYFERMKPVKLLAHATDVKVGQMLWLKCEELCSLKGNS